VIYPQLDSEYFDETEESSRSRVHSQYGSRFMVSESGKSNYFQFSSDICDCIRRMLEGGKFDIGIH